MQGEAESCLLMTFPFQRPKRHDKGRKNKNEQSGDSSAFQVILLSFLPLYCLTTSMYIRLSIIDSILHTMALVRVGIRTNCRCSCVGEANSRAILEEVVSQDQVPAPGYWLEKELSFRRLEIP